jgi:multiple sugar transport system substrate-binding protein
LPAGPVRNASIDGADVWSISALSGDPEMAMELIQFYLAPEVQKRQVIDTGWLPARLSVLADAEVQAAVPHASVVLQQAQYPYSSFWTPDYDAVTQAIGEEIQRALAGEKTAHQALQDASDSVTAILEERLME